MKPGDRQTAIKSLKHKKPPNYIEGVRGLKSLGVKDLSYKLIFLANAIEIKNNPLNIYEEETTEVFMLKDNINSAFKRNLIVSLVKCQQTEEDRFKNSLLIRIFTKILPHPSLEVEYNPHIVKFIEILKTANYYYLYMSFAMEEHLKNASYSWKIA